MNLSGLLGIASMDCLKPVAGKNGFNKTVHWVYVAECLDYNLTDFSWINGGELVFITGKNLHGGYEELVKFIGELARKNAAGLVINTGPYIPSIPPQALEAADKLELPLFELSWNVKLVELTQLICRKIIADELSLKSAKQIMDLLIFDKNFDDEAAAERQAGMFGIDLSKKSGVGVLKIQSCGGDSSQKKVYEFASLLKKAADTLAFFFAKYSKKVLLTCGGMSVYFLFGCERREISSMRKILNDAVKALNDDRSFKSGGFFVHIGVGDFYSGAAKQRRSYCEAECALAIIGFEKKQDSVQFFGESGIYPLLFAIEDKKTLRRYYQNTLFPLDEYDKIKKAQLCVTLETYLTKNCNLESTAKTLFIHKNTLKYRIEKIEALTGKDLKTTENRSLFFAAFKLRHLM